MTQAPPPTSASWRTLPWATLLLAAATAILSVHAAVEISGSWLARVRIVQLEDYGLRLGYLRDLQLWRLVTAQLVHVKQPHMVSSVFCLLLVGAAVERNLGFVRLCLLWLVGGSLATLFSTLFVPAPWNLGTGASQAIMAISGAGLWLAWTGVDRSRFLIASVAFAIGLAFLIDIVHVHYPKPGHVAGVVLGLLIAWLYTASSRARSQAGTPT